jgi:hypothetical protein
MVQVFGSIDHITARFSAFIFVSLFVLIVTLEYVFKYLKIVTDRHGYSDVFEKLKKELTVLGIISFTVFVYQSADNNNAHSRDLLAFETVHIIILFIGIAFIIQAVMLIRYAHIGGRQLLAATRKSFASLIKQVQDIQSSPNSFSYWAFHYCPTWLPIFPLCRTEVEYRIIEKFFLEQHPLPSGFRFSKYATMLFKVFHTQSYCIIVLIYVTFVSILGVYL